MCLHVLAPLWEKRKGTFQAAAVVCCRPRDGAAAAGLIEPSVAQDDAAMKPGAESFNFLISKSNGWGGPWMILACLQRCQQKKKKKAKSDRFIENDPGCLFSKIPPLFFNLSLCYRNEVNIEQDGAVYTLNSLCGLKGPSFLPNLPPGLL